MPHHQLRESLRALLTEQVGIFRHEAALADAAGQIRRLRGQYAAVGCRTPPGPFNFEILQALELEGLLYVAEVIAKGALPRRESRGSHFRSDYPARNDAEWLKHTLARLDGGEISFSYTRRGHQPSCAPSTNLLKHAAPFRFDILASASRSSLGRAAVRPASKATSWK